MAPKEPYRQSKWGDASLLLKYISGASPKGPKGAILGEFSLKHECKVEELSYLANKSKVGFHLTN